MRLLVLEVLSHVLVLFMPLFGAFLGFVVASFLRLNPPWRLRVIMVPSVLLAPCPILITPGFDLGPAVLVLLRGFVQGPDLLALVTALLSMLILTIVNTGVTKYIKS
jgi:hypothetical protein